MNTRKTVYEKLFTEKVELAKHEVELGLMDDINKLKSTLIAEWKSHTSKRDSWGANASKLLAAVGEQERSGLVLKKEVDLFDKKLLDISSQITKLRNQAESLGLQLPQDVNLLDGVSINAWGNKFVDTREVVDEFSNELK
jgi:uncharacterized coiled-coil DUF342 family protein